MNHRLGYLTDVFGFFLKVHFGICRILRCTFLTNQYPNRVPVGFSICFALDKQVTVIKLGINMYPSIIQTMRELTQHS